MSTTSPEKLFHIEVCGIYRGNNVVGIQVGSSHGEKVYIGLSLVSTMFSPQQAVSYICPYILY
jgi:hypothetical protein